MPRLRSIVLHTQSAVTVAAALFVLCVSGCAAPRTEPGFLAVAAGEYSAAFDAVEEVARSYGLAPALRDRRMGIFETEPVIAGSLLEPWDRATVTFEQAAAGTVALTRRRARFEFRPAGFSAAQQGQSDERDPWEHDLTRVDPNEVLELRIWVYNEQAHVPGIRRSHWSRRLTTFTEVIDSASGEPLPPLWTTVSRDTALESRLLSEIGRFTAQ